MYINQNLIIVFSHDHNANIVYCSTLFEALVEKIIISKVMCNNENVYNDILLIAFYVAHLN